MKSTDTKIEEWKKKHTIEKKTHRMKTKILEWILSKQKRRKKKENNDRST